MAQLGFAIGLLNLYLPFALVYILVWATIRLAIRGVRPKAAGDYGEEYGSKRLVYILGYLPYRSLMLASVFIPIAFGPFFWPGLILFILGAGLNIIALVTFIRSNEDLKTGGVYRYSRNPMYTANLIYILGLNLLGWAGTWANLLFIILTIFWISGTHWSILKEEAFLGRRFGRAYTDYKKRTPRYLFK